MPPGLPTRRHIERCVEKAADSSARSRPRSKRLRVGAGDVDASWRGSFPENINVSILFGTAIASRRARRLAPRVNPPNRHGVAHAPSPDVRFGHPALRSLHAGCASPSWLRWPPSPAPGAWAAPHLRFQWDRGHRQHKRAHRLFIIEPLGSGELFLNQTSARLHGSGGSTPAGRRPGRMPPALQNRPKMAPAVARTRRSPSPARRGTLLPARVPGVSRGL